MAFFYIRLIWCQWHFMSCIKISSSHLNNLWYYILNAVLYDLLLYMHCCRKFLFSCCFLLILLPYNLYSNIFFQMKPLVACKLSWRALSSLLPSNRKLMLRRLLHNRPKRLSEMFQKASDIPKEGETTSVSHKVTYL